MSVCLVEVIRGHLDLHGSGALSTEMGLGVDRTSQGTGGQRRGDKTKIESIVATDYPGPS